LQQQAAGMVPSIYQSLFQPAAMLEYAGQDPARRLAQFAPMAFSAGGLGGTSTSRQTATMPQQPFNWLQPVGLLGSFF
jgi:hypothetical protein